MVSQDGQDRIYALIPEGNRRYEIWTLIAGDLGECVRENTTKVRAIQYLQKQHHNMRYSEDKSSGISIITIIHKIRVRVFWTVVDAEFGKSHGNEIIFVDKIPDLDEVDDWMNLDAESREYHIPKLPKFAMKMNTTPCPADWKVKRIVPLDGAKEKN